MFSLHGFHRMNKQLFLIFLLYKWLLYNSIQWYKEAQDNPTRFLKPETILTGCMWNSTYNTENCFTTYITWPIIWASYDMVEKLTNCWFEASLPPIWQRVRNLKAGTDKKEAKTQVNKATSREYFDVINFLLGSFQKNSSRSLFDWLI